MCLCFVCCGVGGNGGSGWSAWARVWEGGMSACVVRLDSLC